MFFILLSAVNNKPTNLNYENLLKQTKIRKII